MLRYHCTKYTTLNGDIPEPLIGMNCVAAAAVDAAVVCCCCSHHISIVDIGQSLPTPASSAVVTQTCTASTCSGALSVCLIGASTAYSSRRVLVLAVPVWCCDALLMACTALSPPVKHGKRQATSSNAKCKLSLFSPLPGRRQCVTRDSQAVHRRSRSSCK
jgi:hypothetical protein